MKCPICGKSAAEHEGGLFCCPFCHKNRPCESYRDNYMRGASKQELFFIECLYYDDKDIYCLARGPETESREEAKEKWNKR